MRHLYLPLTFEHDAPTQTWCAQGVDVRGQLFGVGAGAHVDAAKDALRAYVLESLLAGAGDGDDFTVDLHATPPATDHLVFSPLDLLPIALRIARTRQQLRQSDLAARLGLSQQAYQKLERPGANPTLATLVRLEQALGQALLIAV